MSRINTNVQSLIARRVLNANLSAQGQALERLSTGLRINSGKDDPAGLIASESLRAAKASLGAAIENSQRADSIMAVAEGGLQEVGNLLLELEGLVDRSANEGGLSQDELDANQLQIDAILASINRIADTTSFGDNQLLNGALDFQVSGTTLSDQRISAITINSAKVPTGSSRAVTVDVLTPTEFAFISAVAPGTGGAISGATTLEVRGNFGADTFTFASGTSAATVVDALNSSKDLTGVSAVLSGTAIFMTSTTFGSDAFVSVEVLSGTVNLSTNDDFGLDGTVNINGVQATVNGLKASVRTGTLSADLILAQDFARMLAAGDSASFDITGGGANFAISPDATLAGRASIGIKSVSTGSLGDGTIGFLSSIGTGQTNGMDSKNFAQAQRVVREAIDQIASFRGRIGAFQKDTIQTNINSLQVTLENITAAESAIRDADFAVETSALTRAQILVSSSTATLQLANSVPQNVLSLLQ